MPEEGEGSTNWKLRNFKPKWIFPHFKLSFVFDTVMESGERIQCGVFVVCIFLETESIAGIQEAFEVQRFLSSLPPLGTLSPSFPC